MDSEQWYMITPNPAVSALIWFVIVVLALYFARKPAHLVLHQLSQTLYSGFRMAAGAIMRGHDAMVDRNREVLLSHGREAAERIIEREFDRIDATVRKDLSKYPTLQRTISQNIKKLEEDFAESSQVPPSPPGWVKAVEAVAKIPSGGDPMVGRTLELIHKSLIEAQGRVEKDYREQTQQRNKLLSKMMPAWRTVQQTLVQVDKNIQSLLDRGRTIDRHMDEYEQIVKGTKRAEQMLSSSSLVQFFISAFVMGIAVGGAVINFNLIARPMSEMVGGNAYIGNFRTADIAALVIILVEISMGLFLMESMRITRLFPVIGALQDRLRMRMLFVSLTILTLLASVEAGLAYMREILVQDELATSAILRGGIEVATAGSFQWITVAAQMGMGFVLPFALVFVAIPLETFIHSLRTVLGVGAAGGLKGLAFVCRLLGNLFRHSGRFLEQLYDMIIFLPVWIEGAVGNRQQSGKRPRMSAAE